MNSIYVVVGSNEDGNVWTVSAHFDYDDATTAMSEAEKAVEAEFGDLDINMFTIEETQLS